MNAKYQVFVSSTFSDLKDERDLVIKAALEMGHIPVGMEMFSAADEEQWNIIKKQIDESDYYVVIVAHRYGSCDALGVSYTEKEYDYAASRGIPTLGFVLDSGTTWPREKSESDTGLIKRLDLFREKVKSKPVSFWKNKEDLYGRCSIALMKAFNAYPREGWVRASTVQDVAASRELTRLSAENSVLRERILDYEAKEDTTKLLDRTQATLAGATRTISVWKKTSTNWEPEQSYQLYRIFETIGPEMQVEISLETLALFVATNVCRIPVAELRKSWPIPRNTLRSLLADLAALDCVRPSTKRKPIADQNEYWCLGERGVELLAHMRRRRLEKGETTPPIEGVNGANFEQKSSVQDVPSSVPLSSLGA
jgi:hypothetical protein